MLDSRYCYTCPPGKALVQADQGCMPCTPGGAVSPPAAPVLTALVPNTAPIGCPNTLPSRLMGSNFTSSTVVTVDGLAVPTTYVSASELQFNMVPPTAAVGVQQIGAMTGGLIAAPTMPFTWTAALVSTLTSLTPPSVVFGAGEPDTLVTVNGGCFLANSTVLLDGVPATSLRNMRAYVDSTKMTFIATPNQFNANTTVMVTVDTNGMISNALPFNYVATIVLPIITCPVVPASVNVGAPNATVVTVTGANFTNTCEVLAGGVAQATTFVNDTTLTYIAQSLLAAPGIVPITVRDTATGGVSIASCPFEFITAVLPIVIELLPPCVELTGSAQTVRVLGEKFTPTSIVQFDGVAQTTVYSSATELRVNVLPAAFLAHNVPTQVTVSNAGAISTPAVPLTFYATPTLTDVAPSFMPTDNTALQEITLTGTNFIDGVSKVYYYGTELPTVSITPTEIKATRDPGAIGSESGPITVLTCIGIVSNNFTVNSGRNPTLNSLSITQTPSGGAGVTVKVYAEDAGAGTNSTVLIDGAPVATIMDGHIPTFVAQSATPKTVQVSVRSHVGNGDADVVIAPLSLPFIYT